MMVKLKNFPNIINFKKITGGKDPVRLVEEFIVRIGFDPEKCNSLRGPDNCRWMISFGDGKELEILLEELKKPPQTKIYMGINVITVPLKGAYNLLVTALEVADGLIGVKISLVGHYIVLSTAIGAIETSLEDLENKYKLVIEHEKWFRDTLLEEVGKEVEYE